MGKVIDGGLVPENDPMFNGGSWMVFSVRKPMAKTYFVLISPDSLRGAGWLGTVI
jgi:hypothetical protein